jgi:hypothetical protein
MRKFGDSPISMGFFIYGFVGDSSFDQMHVQYLFYLGICILMLKSKDGEK